MGLYVVMVRAVFSCAVPVIVKVLFDIVELDVFVIVVILFNFDPLLTLKCLYNIEYKYIKPNIDVDNIINKKVI